MLPYECLEYVWSRRKKPGRDHVASTVSASVEHFGYLVNFVTTTCLWIPSMKARDRAKVVEHWIKVARVCDGRPSGDPIRSLEQCLFCFSGAQG